MRIKKRSSESEETLSSLWLSVLSLLCNFSIVLLLDRLLFIPHEPFRLFHSPFHPFTPPLPYPLPGKSPRALGQAQPSQAKLMLSLFSLNFFFFIHKILPNLRPTSLSFFFRQKVGIRTLAPLIPSTPPGE